MILHHHIALAVAASGLVILGARAIPNNGEPSNVIERTNETPVKAGCQVRGVWELESVSQDGKDQPLAGSKQLKVVTARHFMWVSQSARRDTLPLKTELDTLRAYRIEGAAGTYTTTDDTFIENVQIAFIPSLVGTPFKSACRTQGGRWHHSFTLPNDTTKGPGPYLHITEIWRRVE